MDKPKFCGAVAMLYVNVRRLVALVAVEEKTITACFENSRHLKKYTTT
jgi:hypothetical protein